MIQGTSSNSGKSFIVTGLCRLFHQMGIKICPYKSQNMSNNSFVTHDGCEISIAQAVQAEAAGLKPEYFMNPILLKPNNNSSSDIILNGKFFNKPAEKNYYKNFTQTYGIKAVKDSLNIIKNNFEAIIIEGAGSPAEINLNKYEIVNMKIARLANVPVILTADVDRGGSLAAVVGTLELLGEDRERVKGIIFNRFRGDIDLFKPAVQWIENYTGIKVLGVLPFVEDVSISGEDSLSISNKKNFGKINIGIIKYPGISNFSDMDLFEKEPDTSITYIDRLDDLNIFDAIILPGVKDTLRALHWLKSNGLFDAIKNFSGFIFGICGGFQILGLDVDCSESLELLPLKTKLDGTKYTSQISGSLYSDLSVKILGYEIHVGGSICCYDNKIYLPLFKINSQPEGIITDDFKIAGSYVHGVFNNDRFRNKWLNRIRHEKKHGERPIYDTSTVKNDSYNKVAEVLKNNLDINFILELLRHEGTNFQFE